MRFTKYFAIAVATLAFQTMSLPTLPVPVRELGVGQRDLASLSKLLEIAKNLISSPNLAPIPKVSASQKRSPEDEGTIKIENDPTPVSGSEFNKKSTLSEPEPEESEGTLTRRATTMDPNVGISQDLPSGIVMFMIIFMLYAMFTAISMKDAD